jgi:hypothetical protein
MRVVVASVAVALIIGLLLGSVVSLSYRRLTEDKSVGDHPPADHSGMPRAAIPEQKSLPAGHQEGPPTKRAVEDSDSARNPDVRPPRPLPEPKQPALRPVAEPVKRLSEVPEPELSLPNIGGWVLLADGATLIVALPDEARLAYIDTVAHKELKRVQLSFKPDRLAVQGKHLCASVQGSGSIHILDLESGADRKEIRLQGTVVDMVSHPERGLVHVATFNPSTVCIYRIFALDAARGTVALAGDLASTQKQMRRDGQLIGPASLYMVSAVSMASGGRILALDPTSLGALYAAYDTGTGPRPEDRRYWLSLMKFAVAGKLEINRVPPTWSAFGNRVPTPSEPGSAAHNPRLLPLGPFWPLQRIGSVGIASTPTVESARGALHVGRDGKIVGVLGGGDQINMFTSEDINARAGTVNCPGAADFVFHPILDMLAAEGRAPGKVRGTALYLFHSNSLTQITWIPLDTGSSANSPRAGRLLTFAARGTRLVYYDWLRGGFLRSFPLALPAADRQALAKAYHAEVPPFVVPGGIEGEQMKILASSPDIAYTPQDMREFVVGAWSGDSQLFARGTKAGAWTDLELPAPAAGRYQVIVYLTGSWDYGIVQFRVNGAKLGNLIDGFHADTVLGPRPIDLGVADLKQGQNTMRVEVIGSNPKSSPPHFSWGLDCVELRRTP